MKKTAIIVIVTLAITCGVTYAQKYSLFVSDFVIPKEVSIDSLKMTYILRQELSNFQKFSVINRNAVSQLLRYGGNGGDVLYTPKKWDLVEHVSDVLLQKDIDFGIIAELKPDHGKLLMTVSLINYEGALIEEEVVADNSEEGIQATLMPVLNLLFRQLHLEENENENPYEYSEMAIVSGGDAVIGSFTGDSNEAPQRTVYVPVFSIDKYEVTNAQYKKFVEATKHPYPYNVVNPELTVWKNGTYPEEMANHPVVNVTWFDAKAYCEWAGKRLPTAIEWEKAARGPYGNIYPWGNEFFQGYANLYVKGLSYETQKTVPVGIFTKSQSYYGAYDLAGNVWEWTTGKGPNANDSRRTAKGGGWGYNGTKHTSRASYNMYFDPNYTSNCLGFRCVR